MKKCRDCQNEVSDQAFACPKCGAPMPALADPGPLIAKWSRLGSGLASGEAWGYEYESKTSLFGLPLLHVCFKYSLWKPLPAKGIISIGQFGIGVINLSQFGIGLISISQFTVAMYAVAQFAFAYSLIAQFGVYIHKGHGMLVIGIDEIISKWIPMLFG